MKRLNLLASGLAVAVLIAPSLAMAHPDPADDHEHGAKIKVVSEHHDNGLHLGQLKKSFVNLRGSVNAINGATISLSTQTGSASGTLVTIDGTNAFIFRDAWIRIPLSQIQINDQLEIWGVKNSNGSVTAILIRDASQGMQQVSINGTVRSVNATDQNFSVQTGDRDISTISISTSTQFSLNGVAGNFADVLTGRTVRVVGAWNPDHARFLASRVEITSNRETFSFSGSLTAINNQVLTVNASGTIYSVDVSSSTFVRRFGGQSSLHEFLVGDVVTVKGTRDGSSTMVKAVQVMNQSISSEIVRTIGLSANNQTVYADVHDRLVLNLPSTYTWSNVHSTNTAVLDLARAPSLGDEGLYLAQASGTTMIMANGDPVCRLSSPGCALASVLFQVKVVVR